MLAQKGTAEVGASVVDPEEDEHGEWHQIGVADAVAHGPESQHIQHGER